MTQEQENTGDGVTVAEPEYKPGYELAVRTAGAELITDDEIRRVYRLAEAMASSGMFKDVKKAEQAFVKMVAGRDLGLSPMQSMQGLHVVEGGITMHYATLGYFVRAREGYDFRAGWLKEVPRLVIDGEPESLPEVVVVWMDEEHPADLREVIGAVVVFTVGGAQRGVSRFTVEDARVARLIKDDKPMAAWNTARRNMLLARAMSNGVKWFVPEVLGGLPVYTDGELDSAKPSVTDSTAVEMEPQGIDLGPKVDAVIERAEELGHVGLSNRAALELALGSRAPAVINKWVRDASKELDEFEAGLKAQSEADEGRSIVEREAEAAAVVEERAEDERADAVVEGEAGEEPVDAEVVPEDEEPGTDSPSMDSPAGEDA